MKKRILAMLLTAVMFLSLFPLTVSARNCEDVTISNALLWDDGSLKSFDVTYDWAPAGNEHLYVVVMDEHSEGSTDYWYQYDKYSHTDPNSIEPSISDFAAYRGINWFAYGGDGRTPQSGYNTVSVSFTKGKVPTNVDKNYSFVMFNAPDGTNYRPTDSLGKLVCKSSALSFENRSGESKSVETKSDNICAKIGTTGYSTLEEAVDAAVDGDVICVVKDTESGRIATGDKSITLKPQGANITISLTGPVLFGEPDGNEQFVLKGGDNKETLTINPKEKTNVFRPIAIRSGNNLTIEDGVVLTGSHFDGQGGGMVYVYKNATFEMKGGEISDCHITSNSYDEKNSQLGRGGAVYVQNGGKFILSGGEIKNCSATVAGGAVYSIGSVDISGGTITGCSAEGLSDNGTVKAKGGAVYLMAGASMIMTDGCISGNSLGKADDMRGAGVYVGTDTELILGGSAKITDNFKGEDSSKIADNIYIKSGCVISIADGTNAPVKGDNGMKIGITSQDTPVEDTSVVITSNGSAEDVSCIRADNKEYEVIFNTDHLELGKHIHEFTITVSGNVLKATCKNGCGEEYDTSPVTLTLTAPEDLAYGGNGKEFTFGTGEAEKWIGAGFILPTIKYAPKTETTPYEFSENAPVNAGEYIAQITVNDKTLQVPFTIEKAEMTLGVNITAPCIPFAPIEFNGKPQELLVKGLTYDEKDLSEFGTFYYSLDGETWTESVPVATQAGEYNPVWYFVGDDNHGDIGSATNPISQPYPTEIEKTEQSEASVVMNDYTYGGTPSVPSLNAAMNENPVITYYYGTENKNTDGTEWKDITGTSLNVGDYYIYAVISETQNYKSQTTQAQKFTVSPLAVEMPAKDTRTFVYNASEQTYNVPSSQWYKVKNNSNKQRNAGSYQVEIELVDKTNTFWKNAESGKETADLKYDFIIKKAELIIEAENRRVTSATLLATVNYKYNVFGLQGNDKLIAEPEFRIQRNLIVPGGADAGSNYTINYRTGRLSVIIIPKAPANTDSKEKEPEITDPEDIEIVETENAETITYRDVVSGSWYEKSVNYVTEQGYMNGIGDGIFGVDNMMTRGMFITMLWRFDGEKYVNYLIMFDDVIPDEWYTEAVRWGASEKVIKGYNENNYGVDDLITREQLVAILYRYAGKLGYDVSVDENRNFLSYDDVFEISEYARPAMFWAIQNGIIIGTSESKLSPKSNATRAQVAVIFERFCGLTK